MPNKKNLQAKLDRLRGEAPTLTPESVQYSNTEIYKYCQKYVSSNRETRPGFLSDDWEPTPDETRIREMYERLCYQPEPTRTDIQGRAYTWDDFYIGRVTDRNNRPCNKYFYFHREAIPKPRFKNPGEPATVEMWEDFWQEDNLWYHATNVLSEVISIIRSRETKPDYFEALRLGERLENQKSFLAGVWSARNMRPPSDEEINKWVFPEKYKPSEIPAGHHLVEYMDSSGNRIYEVEKLEDGELRGQEPSKANGTSDPN